MADVFLITEIVATPQLATQRSDNSVSIPGTEESIWRPGTNYKDGTGSKCPITYKSASVDAKLSPDLKMKGSILLSKKWAGKSFVIRGSLDVGGTKSIIFSSAERTAPPTIPDTGYPIVIDGQTFSFDNPTSGHVCPVPYHIVGDLAWAVVSTTSDEIKCPTTTLLELNWAIATAPKGPNFVPNKTGKLGVDFEGMYPIRVFRFFLPLNLEVPQSSDFTARYKKWWTGWIMEKIWNYGNPNPGNKLQYDTTSGGSSYNMGHCGGSFDLKTWVDNPKPFLNCYDLAGISQLGCCILVETDSSDALQSLWVFQYPYGYILKGALYGWVAKGLCNNPFWQSSPTTNILVDPGSTQNSPPPNTRHPFGNHAWLEVVTENDLVGRKAIDATVANWPGSGNPPPNPPYPELGTRNRGEYQDAHVDKAAGGYGNLDPNISTAPHSLGNCYLNDTYLLKYTGPPPGGMPRLGVYSATGTMPPIRLNSTVVLPPVVPTPPRISQRRLDAMEFITAAGGQVQPISDAGGGINDAPLTEAVITGLVSQDTNLRYQGADLRLAPGLAQAEYMFKDTAQQGDKGDLSVTVRVFENTEDPVGALAAALSGFERDLADITRPLPQPIGSHSIATTRNIYFIRGNVLVLLAFQALELPSTDDFSNAIMIALRIESHMAQSTDAPAFRSPSTDLSELVRTVKVGEPFKLKCSGSDDFAAVAVCSSSDPETILPTGPADSGAFTLYALKKGTADITFTVAHSDTLYPQSRTISITAE